MKWKITKSLALNLAQSKTSLSSKRVLTAASLPGPPACQGHRWPRWQDGQACQCWLASGHSVAGCPRGTASTVRNEGQWWEQGQDLGWDLMDELGVCHPVWWAMGRRRVCRTVWGTERRSVRLARAGGIGWSLMKKFGFYPKNNEKPFAGF